MVFHHKKAFIALEILAVLSSSLATFGALGAAAALLGGLSPGALPLEPLPPPWCSVLTFFLFSPPPPALRLSFSLPPLWNFLISFSRCL